MFKKIMLPSDGSDLSNKAIEKTVQFAKENGSTVVGLSVEQIYPYFPYADLPGAEERAAQNAKKVADIAGKAGVPFETHSVKGKSPHEEILKAASLFNCDSIFMSSHGEKGLDRLLLGSVTQKILLHSPLPVVVLK